MSLDDPFDTEPPTDGASVDYSKTEPPPEAPSTHPDLAYYVCPVCHADSPASCDFCMGTGIIDRNMMDNFKKKAGE